MASALAVLGSGGALAALATYLVARRQFSGQIASTDAATLWAESQAMRRELREEVIALRREIDELRAQLRELRGREAARERKPPNE